MLCSKRYGPITQIRLARTALGKPLRTVHAYLVDGLLIDSGPPVTAAEMTSWCSEQSIQQVVNTHHHEDHSGGNNLLHASLGLPIAAPRDALPILSDAPRLAFYRRLVWGQPKTMTAQPLESVIETAHHRFKIIATPGHSPDHVCFFEPDEGWVFSGDLFIHEQAHYLNVDENVNQILVSLRHILDLHPGLLICSHRGFVREGEGALERKIAYWEGLTTDAHRLRERGHSVRQTTRALLGPEGLASYLSRGHFSKQNLIVALLRDIKQRPSPSTFPG